MTSPPRPPSPPSGPPFGTNFSRRKLTQPRPPFPACAKTLIRSTNIGSISRQQFLVERFGLLRDRRPAEFFLRALASGVAKFLAERRIGHQLIDPRR